MEKRFPMFMIVLFFLGACAHATPLPYSNPPAGKSAVPPVDVRLAIKKDVLIAHFRVQAKKIYAKSELPHGEYPYDYDVVELMLTNSLAARPAYYEFEVSPYNQALQVNVFVPRQEYYFGVKNGFEHSARITADGWEAEMKIPLATLGWDGHEALHLIGNAYSALGEKETRVYWSLFELPPGKPDFHVPSAFHSLDRM